MVQGILNENNTHNIIRKLSLVLLSIKEIYGFSHNIKNA